MTRRTILFAIGGLVALLSAKRAEAECTVRPVAGTVGFRVAQQSQHTNAQAYGAVQLANEALFTNKEVDTDGDGKPDRVEPFSGDWTIAFSLHNVFNVTRVPTIYEGDCFDLSTGERRTFGMHAVDLYASASAYRFRIPGLKQVSFFYAGSVTGSTMGLPDPANSGSWFDRVLKTRYNTSYAYGLAAIPLAALAPLAPLINKDNPPTQLAGDFISGLEVDLPSIGAARVGYAYSRGIFTNLSADRVRMMVEGLVTQEFQSFALLKAGFREIPTLANVGRTTLFGRRMELAAPRPEDGAKIAKHSLDDLTLTTAHIEQTDIGGYVDLRVAYAFTPSPFVHEARIGLHGSADDKDDPWRYVRANVGLVQLPRLPFYGVEGGRAFSFDVAFNVSSDTADFQMGIERNVPNLLMVFPYAYDATSLFVRGTFRDGTEGKGKGNP